MLDLCRLIKKNIATFAIINVLLFTVGVRAQRCEGLDFSNSRIASPLNIKRSQFHKEILRKVVDGKFTGSTETEVEAQRLSFASLLELLNFDSQFLSEYTERRVGDGPAFSTPTEVSEIPQILDRHESSRIKNLVTKVDFDSINLARLAYEHPALFQVMFHVVLESHYDIVTVEKFVKAMPNSWLRKSIAKSFITSAVTNESVRKCVSLLIDLGMHDEYTREHSIMVAMMALRLYIKVMSLPQNVISEVMKITPLGHNLKSKLLVSEETFNTLHGHPYFNVQKLTKHPIRMIRATLTKDQYSNAPELISRLSEETQSLLREIYPDLNKTDWTPFGPKGTELSETTERVLLIANPGDLGILRLMGITYQDVKTDQTMYFASLDMKYDEFLEKYGDDFKSHSLGSMEKAFWAAALHDAGKKQVPLEILNKNGRLTPEEYMVMQAHPLASVALILKALGPDSPDLGIALMAMLHHVHYDGSGYPRGLKGINVPLLARLMSIVDAVHAMLSDRPYRKGQADQYAIDVFLRDRDPNNPRQQWDTFLVDLQRALMAIASYRESEEQEGGGSGALSLSAGGTPRELGVPQGPGVSRHPIRSN